MPKHDKTSGEMKNSTTSHVGSGANEEEASTSYTVCKEHSLRMVEATLRRCAMGWLKEQDPTRSALPGHQDENHFWECILDTDSSSDSSDDEVGCQEKLSSTRNH